MWGGGGIFVQATPPPTQKSGGGDASPIPPPPLGIYASAPLSDPPSEKMNRLKNWSPPGQ